MSGMSRRLVWLQLIIGWLPVWALITALVAVVHRDTSVHMAVIIALRGIVAAAALGVVVQRLLERFPWPRRVTGPFVAGHLLAALAYSVAWLLLNSAIESVIHARLGLA